MYLKRLEIQGFKTFAPRTVLEFRPGITAIIGPNGSGKSNLLDAVRWVLGEQSFSQLRSKRAEDLIFGGGSRRAPAGFAEVALTIDNSDRLLPLPYSEVTFTRRATRAGDSEYQINRSRVRLRDLQEAIGPLGGSYTIINQGLVDAALNLRADERRRLFEDAAEIGVYEQRKAEAERRMRETAANIQRCDDVLADLEPRLRSLKRQAALARSHRELQQALREALLRSYGAQRRAGRASLARAEAAQSEADTLLAASRARQSAGQGELQSLRDELRARRERLQALHAESARLHDRAEAAQRDLAVGNERAAALERRAEELARRQLEIEGRRAEAERERAEAAARLADAEARLEAQRASVAADEQALREREAQRRLARQTLDQAQRAELQAEAALADARRRAEQIRQRRERLARERAALAPAVAAAAQAAAARRADAEQAEAAAQAAAEGVSQAAARADEARAELERTQAALARADEQAAQARRSLADSEARLESLARLQRSHTGAFAGVRAAMQWAEAERRQGFTLVSSIVRTPPELETAVEVALGSRIQNIVVERWADAEDAIEALKRSGAGRATFLPLDTIRRGGDDGRAPRPHGSVLGVAADLVEYDEQYAPVVRQLLGRTLVVRDLATARAELRGLGGGWTIVTLAGEQVSSGGAVTGGAQVRESGALRRERELRELPELVESQRAALGEARAAREDLASRSAAADQARRDAEQQRRRLQHEQDLRRDALDRARRLAAQAEADQALQARRDQQVEGDLRDLDEQERALEAEQSQLAEREAEARARLAALRDEDQERAAAEQADRQRLADLRAALAAAEGEARAERTLLASHAQSAARLESERAENARAAEEQSRDRAALAERTRELEAGHAALLAAIDELRRQIDPAEAEVAGGEQAQLALEQEASALTDALLAAEAAHGRAAIDVQRARDRLDSLWERAAGDDLDLDQLPEPEGEGAEPDEGLQEQIQGLRARMQRLGAINPLALEEYEESSTRFDFLSTQLADLRSAERSLAELIAELDGAMRTRFETTFRSVAAEFERSFEKLFGGGQARLILTRPDGEEHDGSAGTQPLGVDIVARPPGKRQQSLALLSGGERALTAAALLFAILKVNPSPFCVLDEVDAALDEANVGRFRDALVELSQQTQFLVITHNRGTIEAADTIYGVSMGDDSASRLLSVRLEEIEGAA